MEILFSVEFLKLCVLEKLVLIKFIPFSHFALYFKKLLFVRFLFSFLSFNKLNFSLKLIIKGFNSLLIFLV